MGGEHSRTSSRHNIWRTNGVVRVTEIHTSEGGRKVGGNTVWVSSLTADMDLKCSLWRTRKLARICYASHTALIVLRGSANIEKSTGTRGWYSSCFWRMSVADLHRTNPGCTYRLPVFRPSVPRCLKSFTPVSWARNFGRFIDGSGVTPPDGYALRPLSKYRTCVCANRAFRSVSGREAGARVHQPGGGVLDGGRRGAAEDMVVATASRAHHSHRTEGSRVRQTSAR